MNTTERTQIINCLMLRSLEPLTGKNYFKQLKIIINKIQLKPKMNQRKSRKKKELKYTKYLAMMKNLNNYLTLSC